ncbi:homoserine kinase [Fusibacter bizertensis]
MVKIRVPATTANIGPGFDTLGLALNLFQTITVEKAEVGNKEVIWSDTPLVSDADNLVLTALEYALNLKSQNNLGYRLTMLSTEIPISRGLGSSAAAIVAGLYAANYLIDFQFTQQNLIDMATALEGHPDNVTPAILGNMVIASMIDENVVHASIPFPDDLQLAIFVPNFKLSTSVSRKVLPENYTKEQCVHNVSRISFLVHSLLTKDYTHLKIALEDEIHQPYRFPIIEDSEIILTMLKGSDAYGCFLSGAGPTIIAMIPKGLVGFQYTINLNNQPLLHQWQLLTVSTNKSGAIVEFIK